MQLTRRKALTLTAPSLVMVAAAACSVAPSAPEKPAAAAAAAGTNKLFLMVDVVQGSGNLTDEQKKTRSCILSNRYAKNSEIVWRARVFDPTSGDLMDDKALSGVQVKLANGKAVDMKYGAHPKDPPGEAYWTGSWRVPKDSATGTLNFSVVASDAKGRSGEFKPFSVPSSLLTVTDEVLADVPAKS